MQENSITKTLSDNLSALQKINRELKTINNVKLNAMYEKLHSKSFIKTLSKTNRQAQSTLCVKVKKKNIRQVPFGVCLDIGSDVLHDYLYQKNILTISLNFNLKNISSEQNSVYFINTLNDKAQLESFITQDKELNKINLDKDLNLLQTQIQSNNRLSFFIPMFASYDNYDEFYEAIHNVRLDIKYLDNY